MMYAAPVVPEVGIPETARAVLKAVRGGEPVATVTVIGVRSTADGGGAVAPAIGRRMLVWDARSAGTLGDAELDERAVALAREALGSSTAVLTREVAMAAAAPALYIEVHGPPPELVIVGAGHIAQPLCRIGAMLRFAVTVLDDRPAFATRERFPEARRLLRVDFGDPFRDVPLGPASHLVLVTRGHKFDYDALRYALRLPVEPSYIGMVGSQRRVRAALQELAAEGIPHDRLLRVHAPIGLDIGAETPDEIAVAIAAEVIRLRRGGTGASLRDRARVVERWLGKGNRG